MKELPIGTEIKLPFTTLKVETVIGHSCENCFFIEVCEENGEFVSESIFVRTNDGEWFSMGELWNSGLLIVE